ncbi:hypothetical protein BDQ17DRAFT_1329376 [Cyathus striatus]|nr:hypothetical protein BDQ17DRAFT_1329376 [Cyathus striatus]
MNSTAQPAPNHPIHLKTHRAFNSLNTLTSPTRKFHSPLHSLSLLGPYSSSPSPSSSQGKETFPNAKMVYEKWNVERVKGGGKEAPLPPLPRTNRMTISVLGELIKLVKKAKEEGEGEASDSSVLAHAEKNTLTPRPLLRNNSLQLLLRLIIQSPPLTLPPRPPLSCTKPWSLSNSGYGDEVRGGKKSSEGTSLPDIRVSV